MRKTLLLVAAASLLASSAYAQNASTPAKAAATLASPFVAGALLPTTSTFSWTTIASKTWSFPWAHGRIPILTGNYVSQGLNATGQYLSNVANPTYFNETLHISHPIQKSGTHSTSADYKQHHSRKSDSGGKAMVGCIFGSAVSLIVVSQIKAAKMGNPPRWRSQAEHERIVASGVERQYELTSDEAQTAPAFCGLGAFAVAASYR